MGGGHANPNTRSTSSGFSIRIDRTGGGPTRTIITGGVPTGDNNGGNGQARIPLLSEYVPNLCVVIILSLIAFSGLFSVRLAAVWEMIAI